MGGRLRFPQDDESHEHHRLVEDSRSESTERADDDRADEKPSCLWIGEGLDEWRESRNPAWQCETRVRGVDGCRVRGFGLLRHRRSRARAARPFLSMMPTRITTNAASRTTYTQCRDS